MAFLQREFLPSNDTYKTKTSAGNTLNFIRGNENVRHSAQGETVFLGGNFLFRIPEYTQRERKCSFRKLQIFISQTADFHFANYRFPFRFVPFCFANYSKPKISSRQRKEGNCRLTGQNRKGVQKRKRLQEKASSLDESVKRMICQWWGSQWGVSDGWRFKISHFDGWRLNFSSFDGWRLIFRNDVYNTNFKNRYACKF